MRTKAIILKKQNTNEYDQLVTCYTEEFGKVTAIAKSVLKPNSVQSMHLDLFNLVDFELVEGRAMPIITGAQVEKIYSGLKDDYNRLSCGYFFSEVIDKIGFEYQKDDKLWNFLVATMDEFNESGPDIKELMKKRQVEFLDILGYALNLSGCTTCDKGKTVGLVAYSIESRGAVCRDCFLGGRRGIVAKDGNLVTDSVIGGIFEALTERRINSLSLMENMLE